MLFPSKILVYSRIAGSKLKSVSGIWRRFVENKPPLPRHKRKLENLAEKRHQLKSQKLQSLGNPDFEQKLAPLRALVKEQADLVRFLKQKESSTENEIGDAVGELKRRRQHLYETESELCPDQDPIDRSKIEDLLHRRFFYQPSFSIYGGVPGLFDLGPLGSSMKWELIRIWRLHFVLEEDCLELETALLTPESVLRVSGHLDRFSDWLTSDPETGDCFRADHIIKTHLETQVEDTEPQERSRLQDILAKVDGMDGSELDGTISSLDLRAPSGQPFAPVRPFNLMFPTQIGPAGQIKGFLRPETAQGIFVNFKRLLEFNRNRLPFSAAQIGRAFRNEISPRRGLLRLREFTLAEIEHFMDPTLRNHCNFQSVADCQVTLWSAAAQQNKLEAESVPIGEAVASGVVSSECMGYFLARSQLFLEAIGLDPVKLRLRQHLPWEMAHYALDCWDAEALTSYGWVECAGIADRDCFDLERHSQATGVALCVEGVGNGWKIKEEILSAEFPDSSAQIRNYLEKLSSQEALELERDMKKQGSVRVELEGAEVCLSERLFEWREGLVPAVLEPSFGLERLLYATLEHNFKVRPGYQIRFFLSLPAGVAPVKCAIFPLSNNQPQFQPFVEQLSRDLRRLHMSQSVEDGSGSIGRRYTKTDEIGTPFALTVDFDTLKPPASVTLRERDSMQQIRVPLEEAASLVADLVKGRRRWADASSIYPSFREQTSKR